MTAAPTAGDVERVEPPRTTTTPEQEPIGRILASLDKLGARIRALAAEPETASVPGQAVEPDVAPERRMTMELKKAVEQISRKRDAIDRRHDLEPSHRGRAGLDRADHVQSLLERALDRRPGAGPAASRADTRAAYADPRFTEERSRFRRDEEPFRASGARLPEPAASLREIEAIEALRGEIGELKTDLRSLMARDEIRALEAQYDGLVSRLDDIRGAVENPRTLADLVQRMAEVRRLLSAAPTEQQIAAMTDRIDALGSRLDSLTADGMPTTAIRDLEQHVIAIANGVGSLDASRIVEAVDARLSDLARHLTDIQDRLAAPNPADRISDLVERQAGVLTQVAQKTDQIPRVAFELERQAGGLERLAQSYEAMPAIAEGLSAVRDAIEKEGERSGRGYELLVERLDDLADRVQQSSGGVDPALLDQIGDQFVEVLQRLDRLQGPPQEAVLAAIEDRFDRLAKTIEDRLKAPTKGALADIGGAVARIEQQIAAAPGADRFASLEDRIAEISAMLKDRPASPVDLGGLEREIAHLGSQLETLARAPVLDGVEAEIRQLANRIDTLSRPTADTDVIEELVLRLAEVVDRIDAPGPDLAVFAEALERIERAVAHGPDEQDIVETAARVATVTYAEMEGRETVTAIAQVQRELDALQSDIRAAAKRDRELLVAINATLDRLVLGAVAPQAVAPLQATAPETAPVASLAGDLAKPSAPAAEDMPVRPARPIETLSAAADLDAPAVAPARGAAFDPLSELTTRLRSPSGAVVEPDFLETEPAPEDPLDLKPLDLLDDAPLEPGSGKPARPAGGLGATPAVELDRFAELPKSEPSKADFIAAARRAAQAAGGADPKAKKQTRSDKADVSATKPEVAPRSGSLLSGLLGRNKRKLLAAAAAIVIVAAAAAGTMLVLRTGSESPPEATAEAPADAGAIEIAPEEMPETAAAPAVTPSEDDVPETAAIDRPAEILPPEAGEAETTPSAETAAATPAIPPAALPDAQSMTAQPLGPASSFTSGSAQPAPAAPAPAAPAPALQPMANLPSPPDAIGPAALRDAALAGDAAAQFEIGARLTEGRGIDQDLAQAALWYEAAARGGLAAAQYRLGSFYEKGQGVPRDVAAAMRWYSAAAEQGNVKAMHNVAVLHAEGALGSPDYAKAAEWFEKAANHGLRDSQYNLGILYARGLGVERDLTASYKWFAIAAEAGDADAAKKRDDVAQTLEKDVLARARLAVETWSAQPEDPATNDVDTSNPAWVAAPDETASVDAWPDITRVQTLLDRLGYEVGPADGKMGEKTRTAITAFQRANGLPETGEIDGALITALGSARL